LRTLFIVPIQTSISPNKRRSTPGSPSDDWFQELDKLNLVLRVKPKEKHRLYRPTKIAILDTGVSDDFAEFVECYKDFVGNEDDDCKDNTGHGTNAVRLIQKVYNKAEIYIGRVFEDSEATANTTTLMSQVCAHIYSFAVLLTSQAIHHAKEIWKVDIIVMPSGFSSENRDMEDKINEARNANILIFAAASNYGNLRDFIFPGRLYKDLKLLCMFSTDHNARALLNFNPSALPDVRSFAILGHDIVLPYVDEPLSGTSYATMIGAAVAGRILDFTRHKDNCVRIRRVEKLNTVEGMSAVFSEMVNGAVDNGYHCMAPWKILPPEVPGENPESKRSRERAYICETISRALEAQYRR
jgi:subtilisin family serine protease